MLPAVLLGALLGCADAAPEPRPNIVFLLADDLGYGDLGCYGHPVLQTPNIDRLAAEGVRATHAYAASPNCSPSRAALLTGRFPYRVGMYDYVPEGSHLYLDESESTVAELLGAAGYQTLLVGKWHLTGGSLESESAEYPGPSEHGFQRWLASERWFTTNPGGLVRDGRPAGPLEGQPSEVVVDEVLHWLKDERDPAAPFVVFAWFHEPHAPTGASPQFRDPYADVEPSVLRLEDDGTQRPELDPRHLPDYLGAVSQLDQDVGRLLSGLDELGVTDETMVIFGSDNGPEHRFRDSFGSTGGLRGAKGHVTEGGLRVPWIVRWPGRLPAGVVCDAPIHGVDLLPTLCAATGVDPPQDVELDGVDTLGALASGAALERPTPLFWWLYHSRGGKQVALRRGKHKLLAAMAHPSPPPTGDMRPPPGVTPMNFIRHAPLTGFELYDLEKDPGETVDLAQERPRRLQALVAELIPLYRKLQSTGPVRNLAIDAR